GGDHSRRPARRAQAASVRRIPARRVHLRRRGGRRAARGGAVSFAPDGGYRTRQLAKGKPAAAHPAALTRVQSPDPSNSHRPGRNRIFSTTYGLCLESAQLFVACEGAFGVSAFPAKSRRVHSARGLDSRGGRGGYLLFH